MKIVGAYDSLEGMDVQKDLCPLFIRETGHVASCKCCPTVRFGTIGIVNSQPIAKYWCGVGGKPEFMEAES